MIENAAEPIRQGGVPIDITEARRITAGWISPSNPDITAFATGHPDWDAEGLIAELRSVIDFIREGSAR